MHLIDFEKFLKLEYPKWENSYNNLKTSSSKLSCNAIIEKKDKEKEIIGVFRQDKKGTFWFIKKKDGTFIKGFNNSSIYITEQEYFNNTLKSLEKFLSK